MTIQSTMLCAALMACAVFGQTDEVFEDCTADETLLIGTFSRGEIARVAADGTTTEGELLNSEGNPILVQDSAVGTGDVCADFDVPQNCIIVMYSLDSEFFLGVIDEDSLRGDGDFAPFLTQIVQLPSTPSLNSLGFDNVGTAAVTDSEGNVYTVNLETGELTDLEAPPPAGSPDEFDLLFYSTQESQWYRIGSDFSSDAALCTVTPGQTQSCTPIEDSDAFCTSGGGIEAVEYLSGDQALIVCINEDQEVRGYYFGIDDAEVLEQWPEITAALDDFNAQADVFFYNSETGGYCATDFDGENPIVEEPEEGDDDDDDSSESSESSESSDSSGSGAAAKAFFAKFAQREEESTLLNEQVQQLESEKQQMQNEENNESENDTQTKATDESYTMVFNVSDASLQMAWIMFAICLMVNITIVVGLYVRNARHKVEVVV